MLKEVELLAVSAALVQVVRKKIKYSENIEKLYHVTNQKHLQSLGLKNLRELRKEEGYRPNGRGLCSLLRGVGVCDELALAILYLSPFLPITLSEPYYITTISILDKHSFTLIHQSEPLHLTVIDKCQVCLSQDFSRLLKINSLGNAIISDPWIYKSTSLKHYQEHLNHAALFDVRPFYEGEIWTQGFSNVIEARRTVPEPDMDLREMVHDFNAIYQSERDELGLEPTYTRGRRFSSVRRSFDNNIFVHNQKIIALKNFLIKIKEKSSNWFQSICQTNRKIEIFTALINELNRVLNRNIYITEDKLKEFFFIALRICPFITDKKPPSNVSFANVDMTVSGKSLLDRSVVPDHEYAFESIDGVSLEHMRYIRSHMQNERQQYQSLLQEIYKEIFSENTGCLLKEIYSPMFQARTYSKAWEILGTVG